MPTSIDRDQVQRLVAEGAQLVDVLPPEEHAESHLPGALSCPLPALTGGASPGSRRTGR